MYYLYQILINFFRGYKYEAIPKDYTNQPPNNLSLVKRNLQIVDEVLDESSKQNVRNFYILQY